MKIGLIDVDSKMPNLALMKIAGFHKQQGDIVKWWSYYESFDRVYASKIFTRSHAAYVPKTAIKGGSGYDLTTALPYEIEHCYPDYSLYKIDYAMGYLTRGCINHCPFCVVPEKEGQLRRHAPLKEFWRDQTKIMLLDNSLTDFPDAQNDIRTLIDAGVRIALRQGFNVRTITPEWAALLAQIKLWKSNAQFYIAWDWPQQKDLVLKGIEILKDAGIKLYRFICYVLTGYNSTLAEDLDRIYTLDALKIDPFVMVYKPTPILQALQRWCNRPQIRHSCTFPEYCLEKGVILLGL